ncbi:DUF2231 domain-containing protein [Brevundimonas sp. VNH65]|uniref:DUF2231 domain-containing protein n=1 Tax=Brevundimonas sp. VNH65 TaxID=3400917 RepID=UPI003C0A86C9
MRTTTLGIRQSLRGLYGLILAFPAALFTIGVLTDIAYLKTAEIQWTNFSQWLITGALVFGGIAAAWSLVAIVLSLRTSIRLWRVVEFGALVLMFVLGLINAFKHSQDGWSSVGAFGLTLSILCSLLALIAGFIAISGASDEEIAR